MIFGIFDSGNVQFPVELIPLGDNRVFGNPLRGASLPSLTLCSPAARELDPAEGMRSHSIAPSDFEGSDCDPAQLLMFRRCSAAVAASVPEFSDSRQAAEEACPYSVHEIF